MKPNTGLLIFILTKFHEIIRKEPQYVLIKNENIAWLGQGGAWHAEKRMWCAW